MRISVEPIPCAPLRQQAWPRYLFNMPTNPYLDIPLLELAEACMKAAEALEPGRRRSDEGRLRLEERLRLLLIATAHRLNPPFFRSFTHDDGTTVAMRDAGLAWAQRASRDARYLVLTHAAERTLGAKAMPWVTHGLMGEPPELVHEVALRDDGGLQRALDALVGLENARK